ncbi:YicC/YloC family endoribonuclease [Carboxydochorda subterranea]|uniref:YicC/YloC family endoribonuclease n=1 Tax=Carboxydichorda subterranea TaxID=3109565 RepID=A0ABZ1C0I1_9FIRM|nr:YicC/YloC family endoribonuclease [Limnochorda sp. L945t]WRP18393.1 YicC/YloC family endoribonuclease [Limnochorda sp. L945t]
MSDASQTAAARSEPPAPASMTGFASIEEDGLSGRVRVEVRTFNHRYLDVVTRLPRAWQPLEPRIRDLVSQRLNRGRVEVVVDAQEPDNPQRTVRVNASALLQYWDQLTRIRQQIGVDAPLSLTDLLVLPEVVQVQEQPVDEEGVWGLLRPVLQEALEQVARMRRREGARLWEDVDRRLSTIDASLGEVERSLPRYMEGYHERLAGRVRELLKAVVPDSAAGPPVLDGGAFQQRLAQEVALAAERADISEEIQRLRSHIWHMRQLAGEPAPGRRMEFLLREMERELSTATAKAPDPAMVHHLVAMRGLVEQIREQVLNFE